MVIIIPFSKTNFTMLAFVGTTIFEAYFAIEQKINSHLVHEEHRVRLATSEFTSFVLFRWNDICQDNDNNANHIPQTWITFKR